MKPDWLRDYALSKISYKPRRTLCRSIKGELVVDEWNDEGRHRWIVPGRNPNVMKSFIEILPEHGVVMARASVLNPYMNNKGISTVRKFYVMAKDKAPANWPSCVTIVQDEDYAAIKDFYDASPFPREPDVLRQQIARGLVVAIKQDGMFVAAGLVDGDKGNTGVIAGIFTLESYRRRGYALKITEALTFLIGQRNKRPILFWQNPVAGRVYQRAGFSFLQEDVALWQIYW
ncbi:hypothetical protein BFX06_06305 [Sulfobacillus thermosulfidooxidans]|nr:hypothetical protein BFX05_03770 [Sulfobacillus thermosulfidooxidans]OLZ13920.1 hypothetical protein BFX06_06305 [Sulfobacillus thermosulfidooxidans]OLZ20538.1 hypothetical protein BFX07_15100 [Sulfobacillus thermosulfidooxidans]